MLLINPSLGIKRKNNNASGGNLKRCIMKAKIGEKVGECKTSQPVNWLTS
jgi:hypothetical protein